MDVIKFCASEVSVLYDLVPDFNYRFSFEQQIKLLINTIETIHPDNWVSSIKYHTAYPMAAYFQLRGFSDPLDPQTTILPPRPSGFIGSPWIWTGQIKRFLKNRINSSNQFARTLGFSYLQGIKRGCAAVPDSFLYRELESHVLAMTTPPKHVPHTIKVNMNTGFEMEEADYWQEPGILRSTDDFDIEEQTVDVIKTTFLPTVGTFFRSYCRPYEPKVYEPSHNSCFEKIRDEGGAYMTIVDELDLKLVESDPIYAKGKIVTNTTYELPQIDNVLQLCRERLKEKHEIREAIETFDEFDDVLPKDFRKGLAAMSSKYLDTAVIPLSEPLKVRTITKSEALSSYASKSLQKAMKNYINRFPSLILTTRPLIPDDFRDVWSREKILEDKIRSYRRSLCSFSFDFDLQVSGDYKAATDKLNIHFTELIFESFLEKLNIPSIDRDIYRQVLYAQRLRYPSRYASRLKARFPQFDVTPDTKDFSVLQKNGQLMGSILSFPILCLANLICYKLALEEFINLENTGAKVVVSVFDLPVLVNGDDIYFRTNSVLYKIWLKYINIAGFQLSVGKNYVHPDTFTINSQCFHYNKVTDTLTEQTYLNVGLLIGQSKSGTVGDVLPVWDLYNKVLLGANNKIHAHNRFLHYHKNTLSDVSKRGFYNFFLPKIIGGLGMQRMHPDIAVEITSRQRQLATFLHNQITEIIEVPKIGKPFMSSIKMVDKNAPVVHYPYQGEQTYTATHVVGPLPQGFTPLNKVKTDLTLMVHTKDNLNAPELRFQGLDSRTLKAFYSSNRYRGKMDFFNFEDSISGNYPYQIIVSDTYDALSYEENLNSLVVRSVMDDILNIVSGDSVPETLQQGALDHLISDPL